MVNNLQTHGIFSSIFLLLISSLIPLYFENIFCMVSVPLNFLKSFIAHNLVYFNEFSMWTMCILLFFDKIFSNSQLHQICWYCFSCKLYLYGFSSLITESLEIFEQTVIGLLLFTVYALFKFIFMVWISSVTMKNRSLHKYIIMSFILDYFLFLKCSLYEFNIVNPGFWLTLL